jgi:hypothetical protein
MVSHERTARGRGLCERRGEVGDRVGDVIWVRRESARLKAKTKMARARRRKERKK